MSGKSTEAASTRPANFVTELTARITAAYVSRNPTSVADLPVVIRSVYEAMTLASAPAAPKAPELAPAVPIKRSIMPDYIVCLEDGKKLKMMKRYLRSAYNMTPDQYRARWGLPPDYPMTAPNYAAARSAFAKANGLGQQPSTREADAEKTKRRASRPKREASAG